MGELRELYQEVILDHSKRPRNFGEPAGANRSAEGYNPLCGDRETVFVRLEDDVLEDVGFRGTGCAISTASASMMTEAIKGKDKADIGTLFGKIHSLLTQQNAVADPSLGKLAALSGVREYPARVKCASLCWHTLNAALERGARTETPATVSTE